MASAAARCSLDVSAARSIEELQAAVRGASGRGWLRVWGHDDDLLDGSLSMAALDSAAPDRPVVAHDRTGHTAVVNSCAAVELGAMDAAPDGVLVERHDVLARAPGVPATDLDRAVEAVAAAWWAAGWTSLTDATHTNGPAALEQFGRWCRSGAIRQDLTVMVSVDALHEVPPFGDVAGPVTVGWAKVMPSLDADGDGGGPGVAAAVGRARDAGFPVAVHVMDVDVLDVTLTALETVPPPPGTFHRVEHCALALPEQVQRLAAIGAAVVVNPSFLLHRAPKYRRRLTEVEHSWLQPTRSLVAAGVRVRAGSDSPVVPADPAEILRAARWRDLGPDESLTTAGADALLAPF